jgi:hypothetical protein
MVPLFYISRLFVESDSIQYRCDDHFTTSPGQVRALHMLTHALIVIRGFRKELGNNVVISKKPFLSQISASIKMRKINDKLVFKKNFIFCWKMSKIANNNSIHNIDTMYVGIFFFI